MKKVLFVTSEWPFQNQPFRAPFVKVLFEQLQKINPEIELYSKPLKRNYLRLLNSRNKIKRIVKSNEIEHIHAFGLNSLQMVPKQLNSICSVSLIGSDVYGVVGKNGKYTLFGNLLFQLSKHRLKKLYGIRSVSGKLLAEVDALISKSQKIEVFPDGVSLKNFPYISKEEAKERLGLNQSIKYVFFPSNINRGVKNFSYAQEILKLVKAMNPCVELLLTGLVDHSQMNLYYRAAEVTLLTSIHEGSPNVIKESIYCKTPVVSTDVGDVKQLIKILDFGKVISQNDAQQGADCVVKMFDLESDLEKETRIDEYFRNNISIEVIANKLNGFWE